MLELQSSDLTVVKRRLGYIQDRGGSIEQLTGPHLVSITAMGHGLEGIAGLLQFLKMHTCGKVFRVDLPWESLTLTLLVAILLLLSLLAGTRLAG